MSGPTTTVFDTNTLIGIVPNLKRPVKFLLDRFFPQTINADSEEVSIDVDLGKRRMAPFCSPLVEGKLVEQRRYQTDKFRPAYVKDKRAPDLRKPAKRMIGERIGGSLTGPEREMANIVAEMTDQMDILDRRMEWMAAQGLLTGTVTVAGEGFETTLIDFGRDPELTVVLAGNAVWGYAGNLNPDGTDPIPEQDIEYWQDLVLKKSGAQVTDIVFTTTAWLKFKQAVGVKGAIYYPKLGDFGNSINPGAQIAKGAVFKGIWGQYSLWLYNEWYVDKDPVTGKDVEYRMLPDGWLLMCGPDLMGIRAYGMILDPDFNYQALPYAPKTWTKEDPGQRLILMQSAPLAIPARVNACLAAQVCAGQAA